MTPRSRLLLRAHRPAVRLRVRQLAAVLACCAWALPSLASATPGTPGAAADKDKKDGAPAPRIELLAGSTRELVPSPDGVSLVARYPVRLEPALDTVRVLGVVKGNRELAAVKEGLQAEVTRAGQVKAIVLSLPVAVPHPLGTYDVLLELAPSAPPAAAPPATASSAAVHISIQVVVPAAGLSAPSRIVMTMYEPHPSELPSIIVRETSRSSAVTLSDARQDGPASAAGVPSPGTITICATAGAICSPLPRLAPGGEATLHPRITAEFPLGTSTGTLRLTAPELERAVEIPFELRLRRSAWCIFWAAMAGLVAGYLLRTAASAYVALGRARERASDVLRSMQDEIRRRPDAQFGNEVAAARDALQQQALSSKPDVLVAAVTAAEAALQAALGKLATRKEDVVKRHGELAKLLPEAPLHLPPETRRALERAAAELELASALLSRDDVGAASRRLESAGRALPREIDASADGWARRARLALARAARLDGLGPVSPDRGGVDSMLAALETGGSADIAPRLAKLDEASRAVWTWGDDRLRQMATLARALGEAPALARAISAADAVADARRDEPEALVAALAETVAPALEAAVRAAAPADAKVKLQIEQLLTTGDLPEAVKAVKPVAQAFASRLGAGPDTVPRRDAARAGAASPPVFAGEPPVAEVRSRPAPAPLVPPLPFFGPVRMGVALLSGTLIAGLSVLVFDKTFVGTFADIFTVFLWAFPLNLTADAVTTAAAKIPARPAAGP